MPSPDRPALLSAAAATVGIAGLLAGCGGSDHSSAKATTTAAPTSAPTTAKAATAAAPSTTVAQAGTPVAATAPAPPSGAQQLQTDGTNGATYWRYSITGTTAQQVVADYQSELQAGGYTVANQGGGGGGWGKWGGTGAGLTAQNGGTYIAVQAGGRTSGPVYFEVCSGPSAQAVQDCENVSDGPDDQDQGDSDSGGT